MAMRHEGAAGPGKSRDVNRVEIQAVERLIIELRGQKVIIDADLARLYGVSTKALNQAAKRKSARFPADFMFKLMKDEKTEVVTNCDHLKRMKYSSTLPYAFTEHGAIMAANVLNSPRAVRMSVFVVRAFVKMRTVLTNTVELARKLSALEGELKARLDIHETAIVTILQRVMDIINPPAVPEPPRRRIGFETNKRWTPRLAG